MLKKTKLNNVHRALEADMVEFSGWDMPIQYTSLTEEHISVREKAGLFDVSHMGEVSLKGKDALNFANYLVTNDITRIVDGQILYTFMCYENGTVVDDLLVYRKSEEDILLVINASNIEKDVEWIKNQKNTYEVMIENLSDTISEVAIQGPNAQDILQLLTDTDLTSIEFFHFKEGVIVDGEKCLVSRTGYTGEDGFEVYCSNDAVEKVWNRLLEVGKDLGIKPIGLGARDTLRFEATLPLYGNELSNEITPLEAGLSMFVKLDKENFIGQSVLVAQKEAGLKRKIVGFELEKGIARHGYDVLSDGKVIGFVTTGYKSPTVNKSIGLAMVDIEFAKLETPIEIQIRKKTQSAKVISKRFLKKKYKK